MIAGEEVQRIDADGSCCVEFKTAPHWTWRSLFYDLKALGDAGEIKRNKTELRSCLEGRWRTFGNMY